MLFRAAVGRKTTSQTCCQYVATSGKLRHSHKYTKFKTSFWKQLPPKPANRKKIRHLA